MKREGLKDERELQSYFIRRIEKFVNAHGRRIIGWDEILEGGLAPNAAVMSWHGESGGIAAAKAGHDVVMTPTSYAYFDYYQSRDTAKEPEAIGGYLPLERVYSYNPIPAALTEAERGHVLGFQANVWTEHIAGRDKLDYMTYPRAAALSEVAWSAPDQKDYAGFLTRLAVHLKRLDALGVHYRRLDRTG
jgi:hexosaminidase